MSAKEDTRERLSVTTRPHTMALLNAMAKATHMSKNDLFTTGIDLLHFVWTELSRGGTIGVRPRGEKDFQPVQIYIPGMTKPFSDTPEG